MKPFHLIIEPGAPFVIPLHPIHLDGMLAYCIGSRWDVTDQCDIHERLKQCLAYDEDLGVFKASAMRMLVTPEAGVTIGSIQRVDDLRNKLTAERFDSRQKTLVLNGGPTKKRLTQRKTYYSPFVHFSGVGHVDQVVSLLRYHLPGLGVDARTSAAGEIRNIRALPGEFNYTEQGRAVRNLPIQVAERFGLSDPEPVALHPPYYNQASVMGFAPDRVNIKAFHDYQQR